VDEFDARRHVGHADIRLAQARTGVVEADGWTRARVPVEGVEHAHRDFLRLGADVEVLGPEPLRRRMSELARALAARYD
jgi:predicted DNA-binding transcriptional regulator YafY